MRHDHADDLHSGTAPWVPDSHFIAPNRAGSPLKAGSHSSGAKGRFQTALDVAPRTLTTVNGLPLRARLPPLGGGPRATASLAVVVTGIGKSFRSADLTFARSLPRLFYLASSATFRAG
jgi:hypothetical protein